MFLPIATQSAMLEEKPLQLTLSILFAPLVLGCSDDCDIQYAPHLPRESIHCRSDEGGKAAIQKQVNAHTEWSFL